MLKFAYTQVVEQEYLKLTMCVTGDTSIYNAVAQISTNENAFLPLQWIQYIF